MWILQAVIALLCNQLLLRHARRGRRAVIAYLEGVGIRPKEIGIRLGLADPSKIAAHVVFWNDVDLNRFLALRRNEEVEKIWLDSLTSSGYPIGAEKFGKISYHSHEAILRGGGYYWYFN